MSPVPRNILPSKLNNNVEKCKNVTKDIFRLEDIFKYEDLRGKHSFVSKPTGAECAVPWNSFLKIIIHAIYHLNGLDVRNHPYESFSTKTLRKRSSEDDHQEASTSTSKDNQEKHEELRDHAQDEDVFESFATTEPEPEPSKKAPRLSSQDMFGPESPPEPSPDLLTPLFEVSTNSADITPKTVRLQILSVVGVDKFGFIGINIIIAI